MANPELKKISPDTNLPLFCNWALIAEQTSKQVNEIVPDIDRLEPKQARMVARYVGLKARNGIVIPHSFPGITAFEFWPFWTVCPMATPIVAEYSDQLKKLFDVAINYNPHTEIINLRKKRTNVSIASTDFQLARHHIFSGYYWPTDVASSLGLLMVMPNKYLQEALRKRQGLAYIHKTSLSDARGKAIQFSQTSYYLDALLVPHNVMTEILTIQGIHFSAARETVQPDLYLLSAKQIGILRDDPNLANHINPFIVTNKLPEAYVTN